MKFLRKYMAKKAFLKMSLTDSLSKMRILLNLLSKEQCSTGPKNEFTASLPIEQICFTFRVLILLFL